VAAKLADAKIEKTIASQPEFRDPANAQVLRDLRTCEMRLWCWTRAGGWSPF
jgi:hypothetical protein